MFQDQCFMPLGLKSQYLNAKPFPHLVLDNFVNPAMLSVLNYEWERVTDWYTKEGKTSIKSSLQKNLPVWASVVINSLYSDAFLKSLSDTIGVDNLVPDPWWAEERRLFGGGLHQINRGGYLKMHVDFNVHPSGEHYRRANLLIYVNEDWNPKWGGELRLGDEISIAPVDGRAVLFGTTPDSWHGHPEPLRTPHGVSRRSIAVYYYTKEPPEGVIKPHTTIYERKEK